MRVSNHTVRSPEEQELEAKRAELERLSELLAERELELTSLRTALGQFERRYQRQVARRYVELDEVRAQIAELIARQRPRDPEAQAESRQRREAATATVGEYAAHEIPGDDGASESFAATENLKRLYRLIALKIHPDKANDEAARKLRTRLMADANAAYARGDLEKLQVLLHEWEFSPDAISGDGTAADLVRLIRSITQVKNRLAAIEQEIEGLKATELYALMVQAKEAANDGRDLLAELSEKINGDIQIARERRARMQGEQRHAG